MVVRLPLLAIALAMMPALTSCKPSAQKPTPPQTTATIPKAATHDIQRIQADAARCATALFSGDIDTLLTLTHPKLIESSGGEKFARQQWQQVIRESKLTSSNPKIETSFPAEPVFLQGQEHEFVVVPLRLDVRRDGARSVEQRLFPIGIRRIGEDRWGYTDGSSRESITKLFPDFPSDYEIPEATFKVTE